MSVALEDGKICEHTGQEHIESLVNINGIGVAVAAELFDKIVHDIVIGAAVPGLVGYFGQRVVRRSYDGR